MGELTNILNGTNAWHLLDSADDFIRKSLESVVEKISSEKTLGSRIGQYHFAFSEYLSGLDGGFNKKSRNGNGFYLMGFEIGSELAQEFDNSLIG